jgi:hypothetical protein
VQEQFVDAKLLPNNKSTSMIDEKPIEEVDNSNMLLARVYCFSG